MAEREALSYERLEKEFAGYVRVTEKQEQAPLIERVLWCLGFLAAGFGSLIGVVLANETGLKVIRTGLVIEISAFVAASALFIIRKWAAIRESHRAFAVECDGDFAKYQQLVQWLRQFSRVSQEKRLRYVNLRRGRMGERLEIFSGGMNKLGVLPVIAILYYQFKDWEFGDWQSLSQVNALGGLLLWTLLLSYLAAWALARLKFRLDSYASALEESLVDGED